MDGLKILTFRGLGCNHFHYYHALAIDHKVQKWTFYGGGVLYNFGKELHDSHILNNNPFVKTATD